MKVGDAEEPTSSEIWARDTTAAIIGDQKEKKEQKNVVWVANDSGDQVKSSGNNKKGLEVREDRNRNFVVPGSAKLQMNFR